MAHPVYYVPAGDVLPVFFDTYDGGTGASITMTGLAVTDIEIYKDGSTTQRASDAGYTLLDTDGIDFDGVTGIHGFSIDTGDNTDASFYTVGAWFTVVVSAITVDAQTVSFVACQFRLMPAEAVAGKPKVDVDAWLGTAAATPSVAGVPEVDLTHVAGATTNVSALATNVDAILTDTAEIGAAGAGLTEAGGTGDQLTAVPWNAAWDAEVQSEVNDGLVALGLDHVVSAAVIGTDVADNSIAARLVSSSATADWDDYVNTTDSLQAIRDRGDAAWTTGGGGSISDIIQWQPLIPAAIDIANTKTYRLGITLTNMLDDLPSTAEITPGTISIDRAAQGGTTWTSVVSDAACSEIAGLIYYDEVFDTGTGYAAGDVLRITFKSQTVTVSANDYEIIGATGRMYYTGIIADTPDVNIAQISGSSSAADALELFALAIDQGTGQLDSGSFAAGALSATAVADGALTAAKFADGYLTAAKIGADAITAAKLAADVTTELQTGLATAAALATVDSNVDAILVDTGTTLPGLIGTPVADLATDIAGVQTTASAVETDTQNIQSRIPAALSSNGNITADMQEINNVLVTGDGQTSTEFSVA